MAIIQKYTGLKRDGVLGKLDGMSWVEFRKMPLLRQQALLSTARAQKKYEKEMLEGEYRCAIQTAVESKLGERAKQSAALEYYIECIGMDAYTTAAEIAKEYGLGKERMKIAAWKLYNICNRSSDADGRLEAADVAEKYELGTMNIKKPALYAYEHYMIEANGWPADISIVYCQKAARVAMKYGFKEKMKDAARKAYGIASREGSKPENHTLSRYFNDMNSIRAEFELAADELPD